MVAHGLGSLHYVYNASQKLTLLNASREKCLVRLLTAKWAIVSGMYKEHRWWKSIDLVHFYDKCTVLKDLRKVEHERKWVSSETHARENWGVVTTVEKWKAYYLLSLWEAEREATSKLIIEKKLSFEFGRSIESMKLVWSINTFNAWEDNMTSTKKGDSAWLKVDAACSTFLLRFSSENRTI